MIDPRHPFVPLSAEEHERACRIAIDAGLLTGTVRVAYLGLEEPHKDDVLAGAELERRARLMLLDTATGEASDLIVNLSLKTLERLTFVDPQVTGDVPQLLSEMTVAAELVNLDPRWTAAIAARGIDPAEVQCDAFTAGNFGFADEVGRRMLRVLPWHRVGDEDNYWARPIEGLIAYVDVVAREVIRVTDLGVTPVPVESGNFMNPGDVVPAARLKPLEITQPDGPSFTLDGHDLSWDQWQVTVGFDMREGLILHRLAFAGRDVIYRASIAEMVVPYGDPSPLRFWTNYFDTGEYLVGRLANSLMLGCDCLGEITYLDAVVAGEDGRPLTLPNAICIHEEDVGTLWKHTEADGRAQTRRSRRLVISYVTTVGNYDYGFYWYLYQDGRLGHEAKLNGILFTAALPDDSRYASRIAPGLSAPFHQHLFCARLDMMVDGRRNRIDEIEAVRLPIGPGNAYGNAFTRSITPLREENEGARLADASKGRVWRVSNPARHNRVGGDVGYVLVPQQTPTLMAAPESSIAARATFATHQLWVTAWDAAERYPAGDFVNQSPAGMGVPAYCAQNRSLDGADIVLWHTFGPTHFPRTEDWPVMPTDHAGFELRPDGFFDRNPALDAPEPVAACGPGHRMPTIYTLDASGERGAPHPDPAGHHPGHQEHAQGHDGHRHGC